MDSLSYSLVANDLIWAMDSIIWKEFNAWKLLEKRKHRTFPETFPETFPGCGFESRLDNKRSLF